MLWEGRSSPDMFKPDERTQHILKPVQNVDI